MYKHMLIATDGSSVGQKAVDQGFELAKTIGAKVTVVKVTEIWSALDVAAGSDTLSTVEKFEAHQAKIARDTLEQVSAQAKQLGIDCEVMHVKDSAPADGILRAANERGCDIIVMGSHGRRGFKKLLLGSQAVDVLTHAKLPVLVCR
ncbi:MAG: hypothetical protein RLZ98_1594 [Pseudomonadota bacterium]|jgi:nucleotide-binding universal stress UspA family protein